MRLEDDELEQAVQDFFYRNEAKALDEGRALGFAEGKAQEVARRRRRGVAHVLFVVLRRRGIEMNKKLSSKILACRDETRLLGWIEKAATATKVADVFD